MHHEYTQHHFALAAPFVQSLAYMLIGVALLLTVSGVAFLVALVIALVMFFWQAHQLRRVRVVVRQGRFFIATPSGWRVFEPLSVRAHRPLFGYFFDYGTLQLDLGHETVRVYYLASFNGLRTQLVRYGYINK